MKKHNGQVKRSTDTQGTLLYTEGNEAKAKLMAEALGKTLVKVEKNKSEVPQMLRKQAG